MRIAIDASSAAVPQKTGVAKYIQRLIEHLEELDDENEYLVFYRLSRWKNRRYFHRPEKGTMRVKLFQEPIFAGRGIDVFHGPDARLPSIRGPKLVGTVHDMFSLVFDEFADDKFRRKKAAQYRDIAERADRVICVSESTRRDFIRFFPEAEEKTCVIYEGVDEQFYPRSEAEVERVKKKYGIDSDYILYVGALSKRKNILRMFEAFRRARQQTGGNLQFAAVGKLTYGKEDILDYVKENRCDGQILLPGYVPDEDLPALYSGARLFLFTTLYEGFGLPILEALACGTPVVTSDVSSMNEIASEATYRVDPSSETKIMRVIVNGLGQCDGIREELRRKNRLTPEFTWRKMAKETLAAYRE